MAFFRGHATCIDFENLALMAAGTLVPLLAALALRLTWALVIAAVPLSLLLVLLGAAS